MLKREGVGILNEVVGNISSQQGDCGVESNLRGEAHPVPAWKRLLDGFCILLSLPLVLPLAFLIAIFIKCVSPGPVLFRQERVGYRGRRFVCLKFRTMTAGASTAQHEEHCRRLMEAGLPMTKLDDQADRRIIPLGRFIRSLGLDELPQLLNVLRGEMSIVGPRPCVPAEFAAYTPEQQGRFGTVPGLTGLWQVSGKNRTTFARMIELDLEYIRRRRLSLDLWIMARTFPVLLGEARRVWARWVARSEPVPAVSASSWLVRQSPADGE